MKRYVIVGTGVSGIAALEAIRQVDPDGDVTLIGDDPHGFYSRPGLAYYLTGELEDQTLYNYPPEAWKRLNARFIRGRAVKIHPQEYSVELEGGRVSIFYDKLLLAPGALALRLTVPGAELEGVVKLDHMEDARHILNLAKKARTAVVTGGGITALEIVEGLRARRVNTHYILRGDRYWPNVLDETESRIVEHRLREDGIRLHHRAEIAEIMGKNGKVTAVRLSNGEVIKCGMVAAAIGIAPRLGLVKDTGIVIDRGILVDEFMQTSLNDIYAAGDAAQAFDPSAGRHVLDSLWTPAREQGFCAGLNMAGQRTPYRKSVPFNVTRLTGLTTTILGTVGNGKPGDVTGIARGDSETWRDLPDAAIAQSGFDVNHLRLVLGEKHMLGAVVMGDQKLSKPLQQIITHKIDISTIRAQLLAPNAPLPDILLKFWAGHVARNE